MQPDLLSVERFFLEAMAQGWASQEEYEQINVPEIPGAKAIPFTYGDFRLLDYYLTHPTSCRSTGSTVIWWRNRPVWTMHYGGWYEEIAVSFLKSCLMEAYADEQRFYGGRGPRFIRDKRFTYLNSIVREDFCNFYGQEFIYDQNGTDCGTHWYHGMSLLAGDERG